ncbi:integrase core domain-containing protein [Amycolatopsis acidiphila]|uniref:integrase core domain-containing protein n=1 Tax=Amycolatopsis acidiphila TaxID=715473 RepID=UPI001E34773C|nr:integrase core domain-containing protein [Amycolatopsis acidiphila]UIJ63960.1 integrase core domain-containing protein [Amycolatopsis acidiphila]
MDPTGQGNTLGRGAVSGGSSHGRPSFSRRPRAPTAAAARSAGATIAFTDSLALQGLSASIGSVGDACDNALAEWITGLFKTELVNRHGPFTNLSEVEYAVMEWVDWYNNARLHSRLEHLTPAEYESAYYAQQLPRRPALV